jgi:hypothetical protein
MTLSRYYTKRGLLTRYSFACGYVEKKGGLSLYMEHGVYHVRGFRQGKKEGDIEEREYHIMGSFAHSKEARKFMSHPFIHTPSRDGSVSISIPR